MEGKKKKKKKEKKKRKIEGERGKMDARIIDKVEIVRRSFNAKD